MKTSTVYSGLTMPQRLRAMVFAFGRSDQEEVERLAASSSDGSYTIWKVRHQFVCLSHLAALHNSLLLEPCAVWLMGQTFGPEETRSLGTAENKAIDASRSESLAEAASVEAAFNGRLSAAGISSTDWRSLRERLLGERAKHVLEMFLKLSTGRENPGLVTQYHDAIEGYFFKGPG